MIRRRIRKGVIYHPFSEQSGCVFLDLQSAETISVLISESDLTQVLLGERLIDKSDECHAAMTSLIDKNILVPFNNKNTDAH